MSSALTFDKPSMMSDEHAWVRALDYAIHAETPATFRKRLADWLPFFPDAAESIDAMQYRDADYAEFRHGLQAERDKRFAGEEWARKFGAILMPENAIRATMLADKAHCPWGAALFRIADVARSPRGGTPSER